VVGGGGPFPNVCDASRPRGLFSLEAEQIRQQYKNRDFEQARSREIDWRMYVSASRRIWTVTDSAESGAQGQSFGRSVLASCWASSVTRSVRVCVCADGSFHFVRYCSTFWMLLAG